MMGLVSGLGGESGFRVGFGFGVWRGVGHFKPELPDLLFVGLDSITTPSEVFHG